MNKEKLLKEYEDTIKRRFDLFMLIEISCRITCG